MQKKRINENPGSGDARNAKEDHQTPCGVGCCTGAITSLASPCSSIFCFLIGLGRMPAVPALELTVSVGGPIPLPYPFVAGACSGACGACCCGGGGGGGGCAANPVGGTPPVCGGTPCCACCNFASLLSSFLFFRSSRAWADSKTRVLIFH